MLHRSMMPDISQKRRLEQVTDVNSTLAICRWLAVDQPVDNLTHERRSELMARIRGRDTGPELRVRRLAHGLGYRYRLHRRDLAGSPDLVFPRHRAAIFVHGCFWHRHSCGRAYQPKTRPEFWAKKFAGNVARDRKSKRALQRNGWRVLVIWECQTSSAKGVTDKLQRFLSTGLEVPETHSDVL